MPLGDLFRRRPPDAENCPACGALLPNGANYCPNCGIRIDEPDAQPLHIVDRATGLFNERFIRPVLEDELEDGAGHCHRLVGKRLEAELTCHALLAEDRDPGLALTAQDGLVAPE